MVLGDLIARLSDEGVAEETLLSLSDLALLAELRGRAEANGLDLGAYTAAAVNRYASEASDEEWVSLIGAMGRARDPAVTYLKRALLAPLGTQVTHSRNPTTNSRSAFR